MFKKAAVVALAFILAFSGVGIIGAQAKETGTKDAQKYNSNTYNYVVEDFSRLVNGKQSSINVLCYTMRLNLSGYGKAGKKINKALKKLVTVDPDLIFGYAEAQAENDYSETVESFYDYVGSWVNYNDGKYLSVVVSRNFYAGGVGNTWNDGYTFNLKTGKRVPITEATGWTLKQIKDRLLANMKADGDEYDETSYATLEKMKESDFKYYLKDGNQCVVTFGAYEISYGGWYREFIIEY